MKPSTYSNLRATLAESMNYVCENHEPIVVTRSNSKPVVLISLEDYESLKDTAYLFASPKNAARLAESMAELNAGKGREVNL
jgi:antitoxin YefM